MPGPCYDWKVRMIQALLIPAQEYGNYITDITRTWPTSGTFTSAQKELYNALLATQRTCISLCRASARNSLDKLHEIAELTLKDNLTQIGFDMSGNVRDSSICLYSSACPLTTHRKRQLRLYSHITWVITSGSTFTIHQGSPARRP